MIYVTLLLAFFKVGLFCFGGAFGMIPLIEETVVRYGWLSESRFFDLVGVCESTPGPIAVNIATYVGGTQAGFLGSLVATLGVVLPSFLIILLIAGLLKDLTHHPLFRGFLRGVQPVVTALILSTGVLLLVKCLGYAGGVQWVGDAASAIILVLLVGGYWLVTCVFHRRMSAVTLIVFAAVLGIVVCEFLP